MDVRAVNKNYGNYLEKILTPTGIKREKINEIHEIAFENWITDITHLFNNFEEINFDSEAFMTDYKAIDVKWEEFILNFVPSEHKSTVKPLLKTSLVEYEALANGIYPILYPEVNTVLKELAKITDLRMHIASSASCKHVRGAVDLHNLSDFFQELIGYDTVKAPKKAESGKYFKQMLQIINTVPERTIFVGDSIEEANLALKFGMRFILVKRKKIYSMKNTLEEQIKIIQNLTELIPIIKELIS